jgi:hypothetical protein
MSLDLMRTHLLTRSTGTHPVFLLSIRRGDVFEGVTERDSPARDSILHMDSAIPVSDTLAVCVVDEVSWCRGGRESRSLQDKFRGAVLWLNADICGNREFVDCLPWDDFNSHLVTGFEAVGKTDLSDNEISDRERP